MKALLLVSFVLAALAVTALAADEQVTTAKAPESEVLTLDDDNFDDMVFPGGADSPPFIVMFYAPWCPHCTNLKPIFANASVLAREDGMKAARFGIFDGTQTTTKLKENHNVSMRGYPTMYYSVRGKMYKYEASRGITHFIFISRMLHIQQSRATGIMDDLSVDTVVQSVEDTGRYSRAAFVFGLPAAAGNKPGKDLLTVVDSTVTLGKSRFAYVDYETEGRQQHVQGALGETIIKASKTEKCAGPQGAVLVVESDAFETPDYFCGEWFEDAAAESKVISADLKTWFTKTAFPAQEMIDGESWPSLSARGMVLVAALKGFGDAPLTKLTDEETLSLRLVAQALNKVEDPVNDLVVGWLDASVHKEFLEGVGVNTETFPTVFVLNPKKEEAYYASDDLRNHLRVASGGIGSEDSITKITAFAEAVARGEVVPGKYHWYGKIADFMRQIPPLSLLQGMLQLGDLEYVAMSSLMLFTPLLLLFAARGGGPDEYPNRGDLIRQQQQQQAIRKKNE